MRCNCLTGILIIPIILILFFVSCQRPKKSEIKFEVSIDSVILEKWTGDPACVKFLELDASMYVYLLNSSTDEIYRQQIKPDKNSKPEIIAMPSQLRENQITGFQQANSLLPLNSDSIVISQKNDDFSYLLSLLVVSTGKIDTLCLLKTENRIFFEQMPDEGINWKYDKNSGKIFLGIVRQDNYGLRTYDLDTEMMATIDVNTGEFTILPLKYPRNYKEKYISNFGRSEYFCINDSLVILTLAMHDTALVYNMESGIIESKLLATKQERKFLLLSSTDFKDNNSDKVRDFSLRTFRYLSVVYNPYTHKYYRFYELFMPEKNDKGLYNIWLDKQFGFTCYDENFNYLGDCVIGNKGMTNISFSGNSVATESGLLVFLNFNQTNGKITKNNVLRLMRINDGN